MGLFQNIPTSPTGQSMELGMQDPNNMAAPNQNAGGKTKIRKTDLSGESGSPTGASMNESIASMKARMPSQGGDEFGGTSQNGGGMANYANTASNTLYDENNSQLREDEIVDGI